MGAEGLRPIRVCYADPPYPGQAARYHVEGTPEYHPDALRWDDPAEHVRLMARLHDEFPDGWALSTSAVALRNLLPGAPEFVRVLAWVKPFAFWKPGQWPAYCWEPVLAEVHARFPRRTSQPDQVLPDTPRDWVAVSVGGNPSPFFGAKPPGFARWLFDLWSLGAHPDDELVDMFPGSGAVTRAWQEYRAGAVRVRNGDEQLVLFGEGEVRG